VDLVPPASWTRRESTGQLATCLGLGPAGNRSFTARLPACRLVRRCLAGCLAIGGDQGSAAGLVAGRWECSVSAAGAGGPSAGPSGAGVGRCCTQGDGWRPVLRLPVGDHGVLFRLNRFR